MYRPLANLARAGIRALAAGRSLLPARSGARILTYHSVRPDGAGPRSSYVHPDHFAQQMAWLAESGRVVVSLSQLAGQLEAGLPVPDQWTCITFDDGYLDNFEHAFPVLRQHQFPATIFLITAKIDRDEAFLTSEQICHMQEFGITFGGHTVDHVSLSTVNSSEARRQIAESGHQVRLITGRPAEHFCYPFGHWHSDVERHVVEAGYRTCCTEQAGPVSSGSNQFRLRRAGILGTDSLHDFALKVKGAYDWWINTYMALEEQRRRRQGG